MKAHILPAIKLTVLCSILLAVIYPLTLLGIAQFSPNKGKGQVITQNKKQYYANVGQSFTEDKYFNSRPSAVGYNAAGSGGSNKSASNAAYLAEVQTRIDSFLIKNPEVKKSDIPVDMITASASGLDPNISVQAARVQTQRIAKVRSIPVETVNQLIAAQIEKPLIGLFGPSKINVLKLNLALDNLK